MGRNRPPSPTAGPHSPGFPALARPRRGRPCRPRRHPALLPPSLRLVLAAGAPPSGGTRAGHRPRHPPPAALCLARPRGPPWGVDAPPLLGRRRGGRGAARKAPSPHPIRGRRLLICRRRRPISGRRRLIRSGKSGSAPGRVCPRGRPPPPSRPSATRPSWRRQPWAAVVHPLRRPHPTRAPPRAPAGVLPNSELDRRTSVTPFACRRRFLRSCERAFPAANQCLTLRSSETLNATMEQEDESAAAMAEQQEGRGGAGEQLAGDLLLHDFERILHSDPLIDEVGFLHPTQFGLLGSDQDGDSASEAPGFHHRFFWCRDHKLAISSDILPELYRAARDAYYNARNAQLPVAHLMSHTKALLILCPDLLTAWNSRKRVLSEKYDFTKLKDELQLCALILSYSPKNESTWSHRRWILKQVAEQLQDIAELIEKESVLVKEIAEKSKMNYRAWRHRCWLIPYMTRNQVLDELKKSTRWSELHVADNCCFHYRRSLLLALLDSCLENREDSLSWESETCLLWKEELRWDETLIRRYQGRESLWNHRRFLSQQWIQQLLAVEETCPSTTSEVDLFITQEIGLLSECLNHPADEFEESHVQAELSALYIVWISKQVPAVKGKLEERLHSVCKGRLKDVLVRACRPEKKRLWMNLLGLADRTE